MQEMKSLEEIKKFLQENKEIILKEFKAEIVGIFGSYARGEQTRESDIDIVVRFREGIYKIYRWSKVANNTKTKKLGAELTITMKL